jgi:hypothetical protein
MISKSAKQQGARMVTSRDDMSLLVCIPFSSTALPHLRPLPAVDVLIRHEPRLQIL